jgi:hypothetical protein
VTNYRRHRIAGGTYVFTVNLADRRSRLLTDNIELPRAAFRDTRRRHPFTIDAIAVLPDNLHAMCGPCRKQTPISRFAGNRSRQPSPAVCRGRNPFRRAAGANASGVFGSAAIGSTRSATRLISRATPITSTSIRSSTAMSGASAIGRFRPFTTWSGSGSTPPIGPAIARTTRTGSANDAMQNVGQADPGAGRRSPWHATGTVDGGLHAQPILRTTC